MSDPLLAIGACGALAIGLGGAVAARALGLARTYVRDLVHVGTGVWVLAWPLWRSPVLPIAITALAAIGVTMAPRRLRDSMSDRDERWSSVVVYVIAYAVFTALAFADAPFPAGGALLALSLGDGVGGAVGRKWGAHFFSAPGGKQKSLEGSIAVLAASAAGVIVASALFGARVSVWTISTTALVAAIAEAAAPRGTDNALVPAAAWIALRLSA